MTDRVPLDHLNSDQYDALCGELERLRADARQCAAQQWPQRLARAEAATDGELRRQLADAIRALGHAETELAGVRALRDRWVKAGPPPLGQPISRGWDRRLAELGGALRPEQQGVHRYLSTGCLHGDHAYCKNMTGLNGAKRPGSCKHCGARCICGCHTAPGPAATEAGRWLLAGSRDLAIPDPEPSDPTQCDGA